MKTKIIPFDLETAKKIQAGEIEGKIKDQSDFEGTIITFDGLNTPLPIVVKFSFPDGDNIFFVGNDGFSTRIKLVLEVPDTFSQFKPFDKVLGKSNSGEWVPDMYSRMTSIGRYICLGGIYEQIIPYEGNQELVGTTDKPKED